MKLITPDIVYHNLEPIYTCDIQSKSEDFIRLATGGFDCVVRLWKLNCTYSTVNDFRPVDLVASLCRHEKRVNVVRWSPSGNILASASDDGVIMLWEKSTDNFQQKFDNDDEVNLETWTPKCLRRHFQDVYDLCWSLNENNLISGSIDCCAILWNLKNTNKVIILKDHKQFVQGVAWDPLDNVVITQSSDRTMRVYRASTRTCIYKVWKSGDRKLFQDGSWRYFFRRLQFSPDGKILVTPAGFYDMKKNVDEPVDIYSSGTSNDNHAAHIFVRHNLSKVAVTIPTGKHAVIGVRFNPVRFSLMHKIEEAVFKLPYRWIFCLILDDGILIYDTEQCVPIVKIFHIHCVSINDACWSPDGHCLVVSSTDGYCSYIYFNTGELGTPYTLVSQTCNSLKPLRTIENIMTEETSLNLTVKNEIKLPIIELDPTEILRASSFLKSSDNSVHDDYESNISDSDVNNEMTEDQQSENEKKEIESKVLNQNSVGVEPVSISTPTQPEIIIQSKKKNGEPDSKKRRLTLTTIP